ncbi:MAG: DDE-type integrase/transposase/recombinase [Pseudomonadota bacterium]
MCSEKAHASPRVIAQLNHEYDPHFDSIRHIDGKWLNNRIESDHAAMKRLLGYQQSFRSSRCAKATLSGIETTRSIKRGHVDNKQTCVKGKLEFIDEQFTAAA